MGFNLTDMSSDLTFTSDQDTHLGDCIGVLLGGDTRLIDCLVGFFITGFRKSYLSPAKAEKIRTLWN